MSSIVNVRFSPKIIREFTPSGLYFIDAQRKLQFIDFYVCRKNWVEYINNSPHFEATDLTEEEINCVGNRDVLGHPPYIEFFSEPHYRFQFFSFPFTRSWVKTYLWFREQLRRVGWVTLDLS